LKIAYSGTSFGSGKNRGTASHAFAVNNAGLLAQIVRRRWQRANAYRTRITQPGRRARATAIGVRNSLTEKPPHPPGTATLKVEFLKLPRFIFDCNLKAIEVCKMSGSRADNSVSYCPPLVISAHEIRTAGSWQKLLADTLSVHDVSIARTTSGTSIWHISLSSVRRLKEGSEMRKDQQNFLPECSVQRAILHKPAANCRSSLEHRIDKFDELHGLSHPLIQGCFCLNKSTELIAGFLDPPSHSHIAIT
jgi:hypothetical protein